MVAGAAAAPSGQLAVQRGAADDGHPGGGRGLQHRPRVTAPAGGGAGGGGAAQVTRTAALPQRQLEAAVGRPQEADHCHRRGLRLN